jgi:hypothetical protein
MTVLKELPKYKFDLVGVQEVRKDKRGTKIYISLWKRE